MLSQSRVRARDCTITPWEPRVRSGSRFGPWLRQVLDGLDTGTPGVRGLLLYPLVRHRAFKDWARSRSLLVPARPLIGQERRRLRTPVHAQLGEDRAHVVLDGLLREEDSLGDLPIGLPLGDQP